MTTLNGRIAREIAEAVTCDGDYFDEDQKVDIIQPILNHWMSIEEAYQRGRSEGTNSGYALNAPRINITASTLGN